jgi:hypothetical protein
MIATTQCKRFCFTFVLSTNVKTEVALTFSHFKEGKYFGGSQGTFERKRVEVT